MSDITADRLVKAYIKIRDKRAEIAQQDKELEEKLKLISAQLLEMCKDTGVEALRTEHGTVTRRVDKKYWTSDWDAFFKFMKEHDVMLVQRRIATTNMAQFLEENPELIPPGLNVESSYAVTIRRK